MVKREIVSKTQIVYLGLSSRLCALGTLSTLEEGLGALNATGSAALQLDSQHVFDDDVFPKDTGIVNVDPIC
ncbi:hypothetical protein Tco_1196260 [Tanacetum coccineum]